MSVIRKITPSEMKTSVSFQCGGPAKENGYFMKAKDLDKIFDDGEVDINEYLDLAKAFRPGEQQKRLNVDFPKTV